MVTLGNANEFFRERNYRSASRLYTELIERRWDFYVYHVNLAASQLALGNHAESLKSFATALLLNREAPRAYWALRNNQDRSPGKRPPALSIIVPVHNTADYLPRCLSSILAQTHTDFELIVINDGSTDSSADVIREFAANDARVVCIENRAASGNPGTPRNQGIELARGTYIGFVDSDDWVEPIFFETLMRTAESNDADMVFAGGFRNHKNGDVSVRRYARTPFNDRTSPLYKYHESFMIWDKVYRTSLVKSLGIRLGETKAAVDVPFILKAYYYLRNAAFCNDLIGYNYRRESDTSVTVKHRKSSDCSFEFEAYRTVHEWARMYHVTSQYRGVIDFRQVNSYLYTLDVIHPDKRSAFAQEARRQLANLNRDEIATLAALADRKHILDKLDAILERRLPSKAPATAAARHERTRPESATVESTPANQRRSTPERKPQAQASKNAGAKPAPALPPFSFHIDGDQPGILFFPDFSHSNPYQKLLYGALSDKYRVRIAGLSKGYLKKDVLKACREQYDVLHVHWLHVLMDFSKDDGADSFLRSLQYAKSLGYRIVYTAHNIISHDSPFRDRELRFRRKASQFFDYILVHGELARKRVLDEIGARPEKVHVVPHGTYEGYYPNYVSPESARRNLGLSPSDFVFLFFGNIRGYKGLDQLLEAYRSIKQQHRCVKLVIAGRALDEASEKLVREVCAADDSVIFRPEFIEDHAVQDFFNSANLVVLPYRNILTSGAVLLSMAFHRPVIAPRAGLIPERITDGEQGYLFDDYRQMSAIMKDCASAFERGQWTDRCSRFDFSTVNDSIRWSSIVSQGPFPELLKAPAPVSGSARSKPFEYCILRILGNDLPFRHEDGQTIRNLTFTLENEREFDGAKKIWVLNRIADQGKKQQLIALLERHRKDYVDIPYDPRELARIPYAFEELPVEEFKLTKEFDALNERTKGIVDTAILKHKNRYLMNNNGARNRALEEGRRYARWIFPWDGNCFISDQAWEALKQSLTDRRDMKYHIVPMDRILDNEILLDRSYVPNPCEEPQIIFRDDATLSFDEDLVYGLKPKIVLLKRLGVPGLWNGWKRLYPWKAHVPVYRPGAFAFAWSGWVARLFSGNREQETDLYARGISREKGMVALLEDMDRKAIFESFDKDRLAFYEEEVLDAVRGDLGRDDGSLSNLAATLERNAKEALAAPLYTVTTKTTLPPSGDIRDYWHPAPYFWPNPRTPDGLPYVYRDGQRVPGTRMYEPESAKYDRTSIQRLFDETTALALYGHVSGNGRFTEKAYRLIRCWFLDEKTAMAPHLTYSQVEMGRNGNKGTASGLIETKDFYYFLDAVRLVKRSPHWTADDDRKMNDWCGAFLRWLNESEQGQAEVRTKNNHGVAYDLQTYALSAFLGDTEQMYAIVVRALSRLKSHVKEDGTQPHEMRRTTTAHYTAFNLHLWLNFHQLMRRTSSVSVIDYTHRYESGPKSPLKLAVDWVLHYADKSWPFEQIDEFDKQRYQHIYHVMAAHSPSIRSRYAAVVAPLRDSRVTFFPHDGIAPYWAMSLASSQQTRPLRRSAEDAVAAHA